ncbi:butyrophilin subfamily 1 member A1-like isoform X2 [Larus michahellis]|uniref:butyrophilin subfamily 1 member A1-like isoform X2 n=1 Tax=Larus michahellis TaxID=119627 RepID=UPI003D9AFA37
MGFPASPRGFLSYFLTLHVLRLGSAEFRVVGPDRPLLATVGQDVVLPCHLSPRADARSLEIRWIRYRFSEIVHLYRNGEDLYGAKMEEYIGRTELVRDGLSGGTLDLRLTGVRPSDDGQYVCTVRDAASYGEAVVELEVAAMGSVPLLSLEAHQDGGIQVVCGSAGWYPQPQVLWKAANGQRLPSVSQRRSSDERGLFEIQDVVVLPFSTTPVLGWQLWVSSSCFQWRHLVSMFISGEGKVSLSRGGWNGGDRGGARLSPGPWTYRGESSCFLKIQMW